MKAVKVDDIGTEHDGYPPTKVTAGSPNVFIDGKAAARVGDPLEPHDKPNSPKHGRVIASGSSTVFINGRPAALTGGAVSCGGVTIGSGTVNIGDQGTTATSPKKATTAEDKCTQSAEEEISGVRFDSEGFIETGAGPTAEEVNHQRFQVTDIPNVMRNVHHWPKSAELMELWFSLPAKEMTEKEKAGSTKADQYSKEHTNTNMFTWDWLLQFKKVQQSVQDINKRLSNPAAIKVLRGSITEYIRGTPQRFPHNRVKAISHKYNAVTLHSDWQYQRSKVVYKAFDDVDDLYGSLGSFGIYAAITKFSIERRTNHLATANRYSVHVTEVGLYMRDTYDFIGDQYLGHWSSAGLDIAYSGGIWNKISDFLEAKTLADVLPNMQPLDNLGTKISNILNAPSIKNIGTDISNKLKNTSIDFIDREYDTPIWSDTTNTLVEAFGNSDYRAYRNNTSLGGDLLLFSDVKPVPVDFSFDIQVQRAEQ